MRATQLPLLIQLALTIMAISKAKPRLPTVLQWNARGLRARLSELRREVSRTPFDILALQEANVLPSEIRLSQYTPYHARTLHPSGRSRSSLYVHVDIDSTEIDMADLCSSAADYVAVTVNMSDFRTTVVSAYVWPNAQWDATDIGVISARCPGRLLICGDFNAHHATWGSMHDTPRGQALADVLLSQHLIVINDGSPTYFRSGGIESVLDLTITTPDVRLLWLPEPDTWGSDHVPIRLMPQHAVPQRCRTRTFIAWNKFREILSDAPQDAGIVESVTMALQRASRKVTLPMRGPVPDMKYLNLRAARRRAQRRARRSGLRADWTLYNRISAVFRRHCNRLQREQWHRLCTSLHPSAYVAKVWRIVQAMLNMPVPRCPLASFAVASKCPLADVLEYFADHFSKVITPPTGIGEHLIPSDLPRQPRCLDEDFTLTELRSALSTCRRRSAPGEDGVTYQALRNLDESFHPRLLEVYNSTWRTGTIPAAWRSSIVRPILKRGRPAH